MRITRLFVLLALAALLAPRVEASRTSVWERNPHSSLTETKSDTASALASLAPAAVANVDGAELPRFDLGDIVLVERELELEQRFDLGPLTLVDLNLLRGPPPSYPETRVGGFELLPPFRVGASASLSLWSRQACGWISCELASDSRYDPWGLNEQGNPQANPYVSMPPTPELDALPRVSTPTAPSEQPSLWSRIKGFKGSVEEWWRKAWSQPAPVLPLDPEVENNQLDVYKESRARGYRDLGDIYAFGAGALVDVAEWEIGGRVIRGVATAGGRVLRVMGGRSGLGPAGSRMALSGPLSEFEKNVMRAEARAIWEARTGRGAMRGGLEIHHRVPLEWTHVVGDDPNQIENLAGVARNAHIQITNAWNAWRHGLNGRVPTASEVLAQAEKIDNEFGAHLTHLKGL